MKHYYMNKEYGHLLTVDELYNDAIEFGYDDITDPTSVEYLNYSLHYSPTNYAVEWPQKSWM